MECLKGKNNYELRTALTINKQLSTNKGSSDVSKKVIFNQF
jgi:hypothetical protein